MDKRRVSVDVAVAERMKNSNSEKFISLVRMHLSFELELNTDEYVWKCLHLFIITLFKNVFQDSIILSMKLCILRKGNKGNGTGCPRKQTKPIARL